VDRVVAMGVDRVVEQEPAQERNIPLWNSWHRGGFHHLKTSFF